MTEYCITDLTNGNQLKGVTKYDVVERMTEWYEAPDSDTEAAIASAIQNIEDWMYGRLNEPMWGPDFLSVLIQVEGDED